MPTIVVSRTALFEALGKSFTDDEFSDLCFEFGIELDDITSEKEMIRRETGVVDDTKSDDVVYKIEIPANRYDLLCLEGLALALRIFLGKQATPQFRVIVPPPEEIIKVTVHPETAQIRPYFVCAVLRNLSFNQERYDSFVELQDKLHQNICRKRSLVAIGTHDLDTLKAPFRYEARPPQNISFVALKEQRTFTADALFRYYNEEKENCKLKDYTKLIQDSPVWPVIYDSNDVVLSLPPVINGNHSRITLDTRNVFIDVTATDLTKARIVLNTVVAMFSGYCEEAYTCEAVQLTYPDGSVMVTPTMEYRTIDAGVDYINRGIGVSLSAAEICTLLNRMQLPSVHDAGRDVVQVTVPPTRSDILHACDVMEDVAIAYGYNNIKVTYPPTPTIARQQLVNKVTDLMRENLAQAGYSECLTWALCSTDDNFTRLRKPDDGSAVKISESKTQEFQLVRTNLIAGLLKTLAHNQGFLNLPIKLFEVSDVVLIDATTETGARNERHVSVLYCGTNSGFEDVHGVLDRIMELNRVSFLHAEMARPAKTKRDDEAKEEKKNDRVYEIRAAEDATFFPGRCADVLVNGQKIGVFGVVHPEVLDAFNIPNPCSALELNLEALIRLGV